MLAPAPVAVRRITAAARTRSGEPEADRSHASEPLELRPEPGSPVVGDGVAFAATSAGLGEKMAARYIVIISRESRGVELDAISRARMGD